MITLELLKRGGFISVAEGEFASSSALQTVLDGLSSAANYDLGGGMFIELQVKTGTLVYTKDNSAPVVGSNGFEIAAATCPIPFLEQITPIQNFNVAGTCTGHYFIGKCK